MMICISTGSIAVKSNNASLKGHGQVPLSLNYLAFKRHVTEVSVDLAQLKYRHELVV